MILLQHTVMFSLRKGFFAAIIAVRWLHAVQVVVEVHIYLPVTGQHQTLIVEQSSHFSLQ